MILIVWLLKIIVSTMTLLKIVTGFFRDDIWPENNSEESSSGMKISVIFTQMLATIMTM